MSQLPEQILNQTGAPFIGTIGQGLGMLNPAQFQGQIQQPITPPQNIPLNMAGEDQKNTESNYYS